MTTSESAAPIDVDKAKNLATGNSKLVVKTPKLVETTKQIDSDDLLLSDDNPRIKQSLKRVFPQGLNKVSQDQIQTTIKNIIWDEWDARSLKKRILTDGQVYEDIYVQKKGNKYVIREGNSRFVAVDKILSEIKSGKLNGVTENDFRKISCKVIRSNATKKEVRMFLTQLHVAGKLPWDTMSQAEEVYLMLHEDGHTFQSVADHLSEPEPAIRKLFRAYEKTVEYGKQYGGNFEHTYVYWKEFYMKPNLQTAAQHDPSLIDKLMKWMDSGIIFNHKQIRLIDKLYKPDVPSKLRNTALKEVEKKHGGIQPAYDMYESLTLDGTVGVFKKIKTVLRKQVNLGVKTLSPSEIKQMVQAANEVIKECNDFKKAATKLGSSAGAAI
jgi:hypothetical protein